MVWGTDPIVADYFTRDAEPDASNRAKHHCNACALVFRTGNNTAMREHLTLPCASLSAATINLINARIAAEATTPKQPTKDARWTEAEEKILLALDAVLPTGRQANRYKTMAEQVGKSAQSCRQKLIHIKENMAVKNGEQQFTKRVLWKKAKKAKTQTEAEDDGDNGELDFADIAPVKSTRSRKVAFKINVEGHGGGKKDPESQPRKSGDTTDAIALKPDQATCKHGSAMKNVKKTLEMPANMSFAAEGFLRCMRWHIHSALTEHKVLRRFYSSDQSLETGWKIFVKSNIPQADKDAIVARIIGLWLDGLDTETFEREVDAKIEKVVLEMSEWAFETGNPMIRTIEEMPTEEEDGDDSDSSYEEEQEDEEDEEVEEA